MSGWRFVWVLAIGVAPLFASQEAADEPFEPLEGLWRAKRSFGPEVRGELIVSERGGLWSAEIAGRRVTARQDGTRLEFELPGGQGSFRGRFDEGLQVLRGHWTQPPPRQVGMPLASPVRLVAREDGSWTGVVVPRASEFTFYLPIRAQPDGTLQTFLKNPDRNLGVFHYMTRVVHGDEGLEFLGNAQEGAPPPVVATGAYDARLDQLVVALPPWPGGTYVFEREDDDAASGFYARGSQPEPYTYVPPPSGRDGWSVGTLEDVGLQLAPLRDMVEQEIDPVPESVHSHEVHGVLIARHGVLAFEEYFHGFHRGEPHDTRSASKSVLSVLVGASIEAGLLGGTDVPVYETLLGEEVPADLDERKKAMTLEHLLTMSSGLFCDDGNPSAPGNEDRMQSQVDQPNWYQYTLDLPMASEPGRTAVYCSASSNLAGAVLSTATGRSLTDLFDELIAEPLGIERYYLGLQPTGELYMGGGIQWMPRDFMKLGQVMLDGGQWKDRRIVSAEWSVHSTSLLLRLRGRDYGYLWWVVDYPYRDYEVSAFFAAGNGGQVLIVVPELALVVNFWGGNYSDSVMRRAQDVLVPQYVLPAIEGE